ncbi:hypothetical protein MRX96_021147 [Rhipicephalus microplus]
MFDNFEQQQIDESRRSLANTSLSAAPPKTSIDLTRLARVAQYRRSLTSIQAALDVNSVPQERDRSTWRELPRRQLRLSVPAAMRVCAVSGGGTGGKGTRREGPSGVVLFFAGGRCHQADPRAAAPDAQKKNEKEKTHTPNNSRGGRTRGGS